jgi:hypothetical protein
MDSTPTTCTCGKTATGAPGPHYRWCDALVDGVEYYIVQDGGRIVANTRAPYREYGTAVYGDELEKQQQEVDAIVKKSDEYLLTESIKTAKVRPVKPAAPWCYELPEMPVDWQDPPTWGQWVSTFEFASFAEAVDFVDHLETWLDPPCRTPPPSFLTLAQYHEHVSQHAKWCRRWGRLTQAPWHVVPASSQAEENPFRSKNRLVRVASWLPQAPHYPPHEPSPPKEGW